MIVGEYQPIIVNESGISSVGMKAGVSTGLADEYFYVVFETQFPANSQVSVVATPKSNNDVGTTVMIKDDGDTSGFSFRCFNSAGVGVVSKINWVATGLYNL